MNQEGIIHGLLLCLIVYATISLLEHVRIHFKLHKIIKQNPMANFNDLQSSINVLIEAVSKVQTDVTNYVILHSADITSAQGGTLAESINAVTASLIQVSDTLNPPVENNPS